MALAQMSGEDINHPSHPIAQGLLASGPLEVSGLLRDLARAFAAEGAGLAQTGHAPLRERLIGVEPALPWVDDPSLPARTGREILPIATSRGDQHFLCASAGPERIVWIEKSAPQVPWQERDRSALGLVGLALARRLGEPSTQSVGADQVRIEDSILVARRLAHVYSNILTSILGFLEMSLGQTAGNAVLRRYLEVALRGAQQGVSFTQRLRLLGCKATASATGVALLPLLNQELGKRAIAGKDVEEVLDVAGELPPVALSAEQVNAILQALLDNAHEAIDQKGRITIRAQAVSLSADELRGWHGRVGPGRYVRLEVADTGSGIGAEALAKLFREPFFSVKARHHGLGLTIVHSILSSQYGGVCLLANPDGGVIARVLLPTVGERKTLS